LRRTNESQLSEGRRLVSRKLRAPAAARADGWQTAQIKPKLAELAKL